MTEQVALKLQDAQALEQQIKKLHKQIEEWSQVKRQWGNLKKVWRDKEFKKFEPAFEDISALYENAENGYIILWEAITATIAAYNMDGCFLGGILLRLPTQFALELASVPSDGWINRNIITTLTPVKANISGFDPKAASRQVSKVWMSTALGDQGELQVLKDLIDSGIPADQIEVKPKGLYFSSGNKAKPDFYIPLQNLICDSKAYRDWSNEKPSIGRFKIRELQKTAQKYADALPDASASNPGEIRLYLPRDTYNNNISQFGAISSGNEFVKVSVLPMSETHKQLNDRKIFFYHYLKDWKDP